MEVASDFLENNSEDQLSLGLVVSVLKEGDSEENEYFILSNVLLANIGEYQAAADVDQLIKKILNEN